jgi:hypothetical protein
MLKEYWIIHQVIGMVIGYGLEGRTNKLRVPGYGLMDRP